MKRATLILAGLMCLPMVGSSSAERASDPGATQRGTGLAIDWHSIDGGPGAPGFSTGGGMTLGGTLGQADAGELPVANLGRVWCYVDADAGGAVQPGDLLTTSDTPGHAMKVSDYARSQGAADVPGAVGLRDNQSGRQRGGAEPHQCPGRSAWDNHQHRPRNIPGKPAADQQAHLPEMRE